MLTVYKSAVKNKTMLDQFLSALLKVFTRIKFSMFLMLNPQLWETIFNLNQNLFRKIKFHKKLIIYLILFFIPLNAKTLEILPDTGNATVSTQQSPSSIQAPNMVKVGLTDMPEVETLNFEYYIKEQAYLQLLEKDVLPYLQQKHIKSPACFISYAWGDPYHEFWVKRFSEMLTKAGVHIILDRWDVKRGNILSEFIKRIEEADHVIVVGTKLYLEKFNRRAVNLKNKEHVVRVEAQLIEYLVGYSTEMGDKVIPIILEGTPEESLPFMLRHKLSSEFSKNDYFEEMLRLVRDLYGIDGRDKPFQEFTEKLRKYTSIITKNITEKEKKEFEEKRIKEIEELDNKILNDINSFKEKAL